MAFERINFFKGFFTRAEDWNKAETYHIEKRRLHNQRLHTPGIVYGFEVEAIMDGTAINVAAGYAIDGQGRDLYLEEGRDIPFDYLEYEPGSRVYLVVRYKEEPVDLREDQVHGAERGENAFFKEGVEVELVKDLPTADEAIELARVEIAEGNNRVRDAKEPTNPELNEINRRYINKAGAARVGTEALEGGFSVPANEESKKLIRTIDEGDPHRFFVANVYPMGDAQVTWYIKSQRSRGNLSYYLCFKSTEETHVRFRVYEFD